MELLHSICFRLPVPIEEWAIQNKQRSNSDWSTVTSVNWEDNLPITFRKFMCDIFLGKFVKASVDSRFVLSFMDLYATCGSIVSGRCIMTSNDAKTRHELLRMAY